MQQQLDAHTRTLAWIVPIADRAAAPLGGVAPARIETPGGVRERVTLLLPRAQVDELRLHAHLRRSTPKQLVSVCIAELACDQPAAGPA